MDSPHSNSMQEKHTVTVVIPTYKRANILSYVLSALTHQTYKDFDVVVVVKPSGDGTEEMVKEFAKSLKLKLVTQKRGRFVDALNLGIAHATGGITAFLDDDAVPALDWVERHVETYTLPNVGGTAGEVIPAFLSGKKVVQFNEGSSQVISDTKPFMDKIGRKLWSCPVSGLEDYLVYISKAGLVSYNFEVANQAHSHITKSLLGMGANMSVLTKALKGFKFSNSWVLGLSNEQFLGWHVWKKGYRILFNPNAKVYHLDHGQTLTRNVIDKKRVVLRQAESQLLFYRLYGLEPGLSKMHRLTWLLFEAATDLKKICAQKETYRLLSLKGKFYSEVIGAKWLLSKSLGGNYDPLQDLERIIK